MDTNKIMTAEIVISNILLVSCIMLILSSLISLEEMNKYKKLCIWTGFSVLSSIFSFLFSMLIYHFNDGETACGLTVGLGTIVICYYVLTHFKERPIVYILFLTYVAVILYITLGSRLGDPVDSIKINPITELKLMLSFPGELRLGFLNILLFIPYGMLLKWSTKKSIFYCFISACLAASMIEAMQLLMQLGQCDTWDIINNGLGSIAGAYMAFYLSKVYNKVSGKVRYIKAVSRRI